MLCACVLLISVLAACSPSAPSNNPEHGMYAYEDYWYSQLSRRQQALYRLLLEKIEAQEEHYVSCEAFSYDEITEVRRALEKERPELNLYVFSADDYDPVNDWEGNNIFGVRYSYRDMAHPGEEEYDFAAIQKEIDLIGAMCDEMIAEMPSGGSIYEKYEYLALKLAGIADYYYSETDTDQEFIYITGPFLHKRAICNSYAAAYQYLCKKADLWCLFVYDGVLPHAYNMIKLETGLYFVDITWCVQNGVDFDYRYFAVTQDQIEIDHAPEKSAPKASNIPISK